MIKLIATLLGSLAAATAPAQDETPETTYFPQQLSARELLVSCASSSLTDTGRQRRRYCAGFISGVEEAVRLVPGASPAGPAGFCVPPRTTSTQLRNAYIRYGGRPRTDLDRPAAMVVIEALQEAYPCKP